MNIKMPYILIEAGQTELGEILFHLENPVNKSDTLDSYHLPVIKRWCESRNLHLDEDFLTSGKLVVRKDGKVFLSDDLISRIDKNTPISSAWPIVKEIREEFFMKVKKDSGEDGYF